MKKIVFTVLITWMVITTNALTDKIDCTQFDKVSAKYIEGSAKNLKEKSSELKLKATVGAEELKEKITINAKSGKKKFDKKPWIDFTKFFKLVKMADGDKDKLRQMYLHFAGGTISRTHSDSRGCQTRP